MSSEPIFVRIVHDGGSVRTMRLIDVDDVEIVLCDDSVAHGLATYRFSRATGEACSNELTVEVLGEVTRGKPIGDLRQLTMFDAPAVYRPMRTRTKRVAVWNIHPDDLERCR